MAGGNDALGVDTLAHFRMGENLVERETKIMHPGDGFVGLGSAVQARHQIEDIAGPQRAVAADMLHVQAGITAAGPIAAKIAVAAPQPPMPCGKDDQWLHPRALPAGRGDTAAPVRHGCVLASNQS